MAALGPSQDETVTAVLVARAGDVDPGVRYRSAWSLARRASPTARAALDRLTTDTDAEVRDAALKALDLRTRSP
ncbi:HEAT repeat domain-containing protein [Streptomyces sp. NPDC059985]|uniref:HEAT repeat domain-containing protein n=1 Tax=Streptomyces sp. NPDC059985 TaxID=3347025 RepID=UPI0036C172D6